jgi:hypothetical protein
MQQLSIGTHESAIATKEEWLTPPWLLKRLGEFDLDPCAPSDSRRPWSTALHHYSIEENGLAKPWEGRVWCNPPYGRKIGVWMQRLADHGNGIGLVIARTDTRAFFDSVWRRADAVLFLRGRLTFHHVSGKISDTGCTAPNVLVAYGTANVEVLRGLEDIGKFIKLRAQPAPLMDAGYLADVKALEDFVKDCGHGQVVQNGCPQCERKIGHKLEDDS